MTSLVDNQGGVKVVQNLETAVRKNIEIQQVTVWDLKIFWEPKFTFPGEQQYHQNNQVQKREVGEKRITINCIKIGYFFN